MTEDSGDGVKGASEEVLTALAKKHGADSIFLNDPDFSEKLHDLSAKVQLEEKLIQRANNEGKTVEELLRETIELRSKFENNNKK